VEAAYDAEIHYTDAMIGRLLETLESLRLMDETLVVLTADHGEIMGTPRLATGRPWCFSHIGLHEDTVRVPLILAGGPVTGPIRLPGMYQLVDVLPTVMELCGLDSRRSGFDGVSAAGAVSSTGENRSRDAVFLSENTYQKQRGVVRGPWKYLRMESPQWAMPMRSLYNLAEDPQEQLNVADTMPDVVRDLDEVLTDYVRETVRGRTDPLRDQALTHPAIPPESYTTY
jgi:arylsulfatase A-like enzyme